MGALDVSAGAPNILGAIYVAPTGTTLPTDTATALDQAFVSLGYVSEDGLVNDNSPESEDIKEWGGKVVLSLQTDRPDKFTLTLIEGLNKVVLKQIYGASNVTEDANGNLTVKATATEATTQSWVFEMVMRGNRARRIVIPNGTITEIGTISYKNNEAIGYEITITDTPDSTGVYHYDYIAAAQ